MVTLIETNHSYEIFKVNPKNKPEKFVLIQNNRPMLREHLKLKHKKLTWTIKSGEIKDRNNYNRLIKAIEDILEPPPPKRRSPAMKAAKNNPANRKKKPKGATTLGGRVN